MGGGVGIDLYGHNGIALGDVNGDLIDDIFLADCGGLPNRLLIHQPDGTLRDISGDSGVDWLDPTPSALLIDLDNDGDQDLVLAHGSKTQVMENDGTAKFTTRATLPPASTSMSAADYDNDGLLDIYLCNYVARSDESGVPIPYHDANNGRPNFLMRNRGGLQFEDVTQSSGIDMNNRRYSMACAWEDYDNDGDQDLYVANDFGRKNLYRNDGGRFVDVAPQAGVEDISAGMGVTWADVNRDGWMDIYTSNMFSSAGNRVAFQRKFRPEADGASRAAMQRHARGNTLFESRRDGTFIDTSVEAGVTMGRWAWGAQFADLNNDGLEDIVVPNGFITNDDKHDL